MAFSPKKDVFVTDHLSPFLAAAKDNAYQRWSAEYMTGDEAKERYPYRDDLDLYDEIVVVTVKLLDNGEEIPYFCNVSMDSIPALITDVWKVVAYK